MLLTFIGLVIFNACVCILVYQTLNIIFNVVVTEGVLRCIITLLEKWRNDLYNWSRAVDWLDSYYAVEISLCLTRPSGRGLPSMLGKPLLMECSAPTALSNT